MYSRCHFRLREERLDIRGGGLILSRFLLGLLMKLRHPIAIKSAAFVLSVWLRTWISMCPVREQFADAATNPKKRQGRYLYVFWHENVIPATTIYVKTGVQAMVSEHRDGELITQIARCLGGDTIRGSSTRGGERALRTMLERSGDTRLAITPDGPRGPRRQMPLGPVYLASRAGIPIVPVGLCSKKAFRINSWDRMAIPRPFMPIYVLGGTPINVPADVARSDMEVYRLLCERGLNEAQAAAEAWSAGVTKAAPTEARG